MLTKEDNELMCRVGRGTPMGELLRQYWMPGLPAAECPPKKVRLLGEDVVGSSTVRSRPRRAAIGEDDA